MDIKETVFTYNKIFILKYRSMESIFLLQSPQTQKMKLKILGEQFEAERNTKTYKLKPKIIGCVWQGPGNLFPASSEYILFKDMYIMYT